MLGINRAVGEIKVALMGGFNILDPQAADAAGHAVDAEGGEDFQVGLDAGAAGAV